VNAEYQTTAVLVPAFNAAKTLPHLIEKLRAYFDSRNIVVINDGSNDDTEKSILSTGATLLRHSTNLGKGAALRTGIEFVRGLPGIQSVLTIDADLQHRPEDIPAFFKARNEGGADVIVGVRKRVRAGMPLARILSNAITSAVVSARTGTAIRDSQCGFRLIRRSVIEEISTESDGYEAETEFLIKAAKRGFRIDFVPVQTVYRNEKSYMTHWRTTVNFVKVLLKEY
jgi:glycosyltransferase involved in cell wall biosynthesis